MVRYEVAVAVSMNCGMYSLIVSCTNENDALTVMVVAPVNVSDDGIVGNG